MSYTVHIILLGRSACGKGAQAKLLAERIAGKTAHIDMGAMIRESKNPKHIELADKGEHLSADDVFELWSNRFSDLLEDNPRAVVHDGIFRGPEQTIMMMDYIRRLGKRHHVIVLDIEVPEGICRRRMNKRVQESTVARNDDKSAESRETKLKLFDQKIGQVYQVLARYGVSPTLIECGEKDENGVFIEIMKRVTAINDIVRTAYRYSGSDLKSGRPAEKRDWMNDSARRKPRTMVSEVKLPADETLVDTQASESSAMSSPIH